MPATWRLIQGDCLQRLAELPAGSVQCVVTSPPYFALRSYLPSAHPDKAREIGSEPTPEAFVATMVAVFREVRRVLRDDGLCFVNLGDSYNQFNANRGEAAGLTDAGQKCGDILNIPHRVAIAMQADGWYWRQTIVWRKPAPMPESIGGWRWERCRVKVGAGECNRMGERTGSGVDYREVVLAKFAPCPGCPKCVPNDGLVLRRGRGRCTTAHEYIFMFAKTANYFWDEAAREAAVGGTPGNKTVGKGGGSDFQKRSMLGRLTTMNTAVETRNSRSVWTMATEPFKGKHFAAFPSSLPKKCIELATSAGGCCPKCGACWAPIIEKKRVATRPGGASKVYGIGDMVLDPSSPYWDHNGTIAGNRDPDRHIQVARVHGYRPTCGCGDVGHAVPCVVLDPFAGTGQTLRAAHWLGRSGVGIDLNQEYLDMAAERIMVPPKWTQPVKAVRVRRVTEDCPLFVEANQ